MATSSAADAASAGTCSRTPVNAATTQSLGQVMKKYTLGGKVVWDEYRFEVTSPGLGEPQWIYTLALPLLSAAVVGRAIGHGIRVWRSSRPPEHHAIEPL